MARIYTTTKDHVVQIGHYGAAGHEVACDVPEHVGRELASRSDLRVEFDAPQQKARKAEITEAVVAEPTAKPEEKRAK